MEEEDQQPLELLVLTKICILKNSTEDLEAWIVKTSYLPPLLAKEIYFMLKIVQSSRKAFEDINPSDMFFVLLRQGLMTYSKNNNPVLLEKTFKTFSRFTKYDAVVRGVKNILEIDYRFLKFLIPRITNLIILNNILILASFHGNFEIVRLCITEGADDLLTAQKAANLNNQDQMTKFLDLEGQSVRFLNSKSYRIYHRVMTSYNNCCESTQQEHYTLIKGYFTQYDPINYIPFHIGDLQIPMACWGGLNIFQLMCSLHVNKTKTLGTLFKKFVMNTE